MPLLWIMTIPEPSPLLSFWIFSLTHLRRTAFVLTQELPLFQRAWIRMIMRAMYMCLLCEYIAAFAGLACGYLMLLLLRLVLIANGVQARWYQEIE